MNPQIPLRFLTEADRDAGAENPAYEAWFQTTLTNFLSCFPQWALHQSSLV